MKKIISALALASLAIGFASADVKFALNYRTQMVGFSRLIHSPENGTDENVNYWFRQPKGWQSASDTVSMSASNDFAGITVRIDPNLDNDNSPTQTLNQYNAYINIGSFQIGAGAWKDGMYNGTYQVKNDSDAGWYQGDLYGAVKLGSLYAGAITLAVDDITNFSGGANSSSAYIKWAGDIGDAEVTVEGSLIGINGATWDEEDSIYTGFGARINAAFENWQAQFVFKTASNKAKETALGEQRAFSLHVNPRTLPFTLVVGGAMGFNNSSLTEANFDLRARKAFGGTSITFYTNVSHITNDCTYITDISKHLGAEYLASSGSVAYSNSNTLVGVSSSQTYNTVMWNMLGVRSKLTDRLFLLFSTGANTSLRNVGTDHWTGMEVFAAPGLMVMNGKSGIAAYARVGMSNVGVKDYDKDGEGADLSLLVPVVIRVRL